MLLSTKPSLQLPPFDFLKLHLLLLFYSVCVCVGTVVCTWRSEDNLKESVLLFYQVGHEM